MKELIGTGVALVTPFKDDLSVDHVALQKIVKYNIENGIEYLVVCGTTGESATLSIAEKREVLDTVSRANANQLPIVLGIGGHDTEKIITEIKSTDLSEVSAILSVGPYYTKPTQEGFYQHYKAIAQNSPVPIILYNVPGRTSKNIEPKTIFRLASDFENIVAVKEAGSNMSQYFQLLRGKPDNFKIISGDDDLALGVTLAGGSGVISVIGQAFPKDFSKMIRLGLAGHAKEAYKTHSKLMDIMELIFSENNPAGIKSTLHALDFCKNNLRLPLVSSTEFLDNEVRAFLDNYDF